MVGLGHTSFIFSLPFCGPNAIPHFLCEIQAVLQLASYDPVTDPLVSLFYAVVTPILNPIIYSLQNTDVKAALKRTIQKMGLAEV
ncbi:hypothetical protein J1605_017734 [Eschrichtius robustus]|uniref:Uncharacterized protein n=1 Tax=Eschrichtius robustus TaxID=9764 RepID=A0AB34HVJ3_ESCRO|nr:hypothetical protein J1605_017734 [Eschrichtius robustus]